MSEFERVVVVLTIQSKSSWCRRKQEVLTNLAPRRAISLVESKLVKSSLVAFDTRLTSSLASVKYRNLETHANGVKEVDQINLR